MVKQNILEKYLEKINNQLVVESVKNNVKSPEDLLKLMKNIKYDNTTSDEDYRIKSPNQVLSTKKAICYDQVELEREYFNKMGLPFKTFFAYDGTTHTFLIFKRNNSFHWFENSFESYRGLIGPFKSYKQAINYIRKVFKKEGWKRWHVNEYKKFNYKNMTIDQFARRAIKKE